MKTVLKVISNVLLAVLALLILANAILIGKRVVTHEMQPTVLGWSWAEVLSGSMEPAISPGDLIVFHRQKEYKTGDIITFEGNTHGITHRIVEVLPEGYRTKGDNNNTEDEQLVPEDQVIGKVLLIIPCMGKILTFFRSPLGFGLLILLGAVFIEVPIYLERGKKD